MKNKVFKTVDYLNKIKEPRKYLGFEFVNNPFRIRVIPRKRTKENCDDILEILEKMGYKFRVKFLFEPYMTFWDVIILEKESKIQDILKEVLL